MSPRRFVVGFALALAVTLALAPTASVAGQPHLITGPLGGLAGAKCIPCSAQRPCTNPLTICVSSGNGGHGCCLGYAGLE